MANTQSKASRAFDRFINMSYGLGASIVIIGALFKIQHYSIGPITGGVMLTLGLVVEAFIFAISAFEPLQPKYDWAAVYPELTGAESSGRSGALRPTDTSDEIDESLSKKLDKMLKDAKIDSQLMESLGTSIKNFEGAAKTIAPTTEALASQKKYSEEMSRAALNMENLNSLYQVQLDSYDKQSSANQAMAQKAEQLQHQMESLTQNISNLNNVYGGMLTAMRPSK